MWKQWVGSCALVLIVTTPLSLSLSLSLSLPPDPLLWEGSESINPTNLSLSLSFSLKPSHFSTQNAVILLLGDNRRLCTNFYARSTGSRPSVPPIFFSPFWRWIASHSIDDRVGTGWDVAVLTYLPSLTTFHFLLFPERTFSYTHTHTYTSFHSVRLLMSFEAFIPLWYPLSLLLLVPFLPWKRKERTGTQARLILSRIFHSTLELRRRGRCGGSGV